MLSFSMQIVFSFVLWRPVRQLWRTAGMDPTSRKFKAFGTSVAMPFCIFQCPASTWKSCTRVRRWIALLRRVEKAPTWFSRTAMSWLLFWNTRESERRLRKRHWGWKRQDVEGFYGTGWSNGHCRVERCPSRNQHEHPPEPRWCDWFKLPGGFCWEMLQWSFGV